MCQAEGIKTAHVREWDDFASAPKERITDRRGIAGDVYTIKIAGAACDAGLDLDEVVRITEKARDNTNTIGLATSPGTLPGNDKPTFEIADDEMEFGMGLHGEPGIERTKMMPCSDMVERMYKELKNEMGLKEGDEVAVLVNSLGSTPLLELNLVYYELYKRMHKDGLKVYDVEIKTYCTCMEMGGFSITLLRLDDELKKYYDEPCFSPYYAKGEFTGASAAVDEGEEEEEPEFDESDVEPAKIVRSTEGVIEELNAEDTRNMLLYVADKIIAKKPYLTEIDSAIGDGDHGIGMAGGMQKAKKKLLKMQGEENAYKMFETAGQAMLMSMGGASGVIFGSLYLAGAKDVDPKAVLTADDLAKMERKSLTAIQQRGGAQVGDKTMVDALSPAVEALEANSGKGLLDMLKAAEEAAGQGVEDTKKYVAKFGRAKSLLERAIGHQDAGATSVYLIFQGMREFVEGTLQ
jgi:dihydroxyacetone kinase